MYSLNVPVPPRVARLAIDVARSIPGSEPRIRGEHTLVVKRLGTGTRDAYDGLQARAREALAGQPPFEIRVSDLDYFAEPATGRSPVTYLAIESPELIALHRRLTRRFGPREELEGDAYVPHVTATRGGSIRDVEAVCDRDIDPIQWTVTELVFWDGERSERISRVSLPA